MDSNLRPQKRASGCSGKRIEVYWRGKQFTSPIHFKWDPRTDFSNDTAFLAGRGQPLNGIFKWYYRNGAIRTVHEYSAGRLLNEKEYRKNGDLLAWFDYDFGYDTTYYSAFTHICDREHGEPYLREWIFTVIDGKLGAYAPSYAWRFRNRALGYSDYH